MGTNSVCHAFSFGRIVRSHEKLTSRKCDLIIAAVLFSQVPPDNHLHRVDHIVGLGGGRAQARVKQLTAKKVGGKFHIYFIIFKAVLTDGMEESIGPTGWSRRD